MKFDHKGTSNLSESQKVKSDVYLFPLVVPLLNPGVGANGLEVLGKEVARLIVLTLHFQESAGCNINHFLRLRREPSASDNGGSRRSSASSFLSGFGWGT